MRRGRWLALALGLTGLPFFPPSNLHAEMPEKRIEVQVSSPARTVDVNVKNHIPGELYTPARPTAWTKFLRFVQRILINGRIELSTLFR